ncbi:MAG: tetratricopeptide repeat protein, partial [Anaerolineales bacterium]
MLTTVKVGTSSINGNVDEVIAHCHHILKTFPKHLETYRLLGKAYLEAHRYNEAVDIFSRVLMSVPNDFVSHVGMSIINDEQNKLDNAIWHMERAFEAQPSNAAIQGELQRLYARRDGLEPPKIRMTRGALAHMYVQGELYPQAIAEIRAVLSEDAQRADMQVLLAKAYFKAGQKADASDMCTQLLKRYPYCFDANRIMVELLPATAGAAESTQVYRMRVGELDPYATFAKGSVFQSNEVADAAINLERLEYTGNEVAVGQDWGSSLGIGLGAGSAAAGVLASGTSSEQPDWLTSGSFSDAEPSSKSNSGSSSSNDEIPDFLRAAGWGESNGEEQPTSFFDSAEPVAGASDLAPADIPDWLKGQMPSDPTPAKSVAPQVGSIETPDWLSGLGDSGPSELDDSQEEASTPMNSGDVPDWLSGLGAPSSEQSQPVQNDTPDWLSGLDSSQPTPQADVPDWLSGLDSSDHSEASDLQPIAAQESNSSDWLSVNDLPATEASDVPDWLSGISSAQPVQDDLAQPANVPDWLSAPKEEPVSNIDNLGASAQEQDDAVAWLESLAAKHGAKPEELVTDPNKRSETPPDWVQQAQAVGEAESAAAESPKEWSADAQNIGEQFFAEFENAASATPAVDSTGMWLRDLDDTKDEPSLQRGDIPDWLSDNQNEKSSESQRTDFPNWESGLQTSDNQEFISENLSQEDLSNWLSNLDDGHQAEEPAPVTRRDVPEWLGQIDDKEEQDDDWKNAIGINPTQEKQNLPSWLDEDDATKEPASAKSSADLPDWLHGVDEQSSADDDDTPPWLTREVWESDNETIAPTPTAPTDWHPIVEPVADVSSTPKPMAAREQPKQVKPQPQSTTAKPTTVAKPAAAKKSGGKSSEPQGSPVVLTQAKGELDRGDIPTALEHYGKLIKKGKHLEETIRDLTESLYRYPVEVGIWQTLGDAYMRANRL